VVLQARQLKISFHLREVSVRIAPPFFSIIWPNHTESADFLALAPVKLQASYYFHRYFSNSFFAEFLRG
jgi:hypothetical protein